MSINIDKKLLRKAWYGADPLEGPMRALPLARFGGTPSYDGEWITNHNPSGGFLAFGTRNAYQGGLTGHLIAKARLKVSVDSSVYMFFYEPTKADFANYQGIDCKDGTVHYCRSRNAGVETLTSIDPQDWLVEHEFKIVHYKDQSAVQFWIDGALVATHTTNISPQPFEILAGEPNGVARNIYLKYPYGVGTQE